MPADDLAGPLTVWIVNYNSSDCLASCLAGLNSIKIRSIVVLDNASAAPDVDAVAELAAGDPRIRLIRSEVNLGFGAGHHRIAAETAGDAVPDELIWILNPDTVVSAAATDTLCAVVQSGAADIVSPVLLYGDRDRPVVWFAGGRVDVRKGTVRHAGVGRPAGAVVPGTGATEFVTGAAPVMSRATWDELGGFRQDLFLYWEDADLSLRARAAGKKLAVAGDAVIWHAEGGSSDETAGTSADTFYYTARNRILVCEQFTRRLRLVAGPGSLPLAVLAGAAFRNGRGHRLANVMAVAVGTLDGWRGRSGRRPGGRLLGGR